MIRVLIVNTVRFARQGMSMVIMNQLNNIDASKFHIDIVATGEIDSSFNDEFIRNNCKVYKLERSKVIRYQRELRRIVNNGKYDIVHIHGNSSTMLLETLALMGSYAKSVIVHSHNTTSNHTAFHLTMRKIFSYTYDRALACGQDAGKWLCGRKPFEVVENGINLEMFAYDEKIRTQQKQLYKCVNKKVIGHVGQFRNQKNHKFLLEVFKEVHSFDSSYLLVCVGDGPNEAIIRDAVSEYGLDDSVYFMGSIANVSEIYNLFDLFVLPSLHEGLPLVLIEAQISGLHCIVSDKVSTEAKKTNLVSYASIDNTSEWIKQIVQRFAEPNNRSQNSRDAVLTLEKKGYSIDTVTQKIESIYRECLGIKSEIF